MSFLRLKRCLKFMEQFWKKIFTSDIRSMADKQPVEEAFVIAGKTPVQSYSKGFMFKIELLDSKGKIPLTFFGPSNQSEVQDFCDSLRVGQVVRVKAAVNIYNG